MPNGALTYQRSEIRRLVCFHGRETRPEHIRWVKLDPTIGAEIQKTRSCLILQNDPMNQYGQLTIAIPFRPGTKQAPSVVNVAASTRKGLERDRFLDVAQIRSIDGQRVSKLVGLLEDNYWPQIQEALSIVYGFGIG